MSDLDSIIDASHRAAEAAEHQALEAIERLSRIQGIQPWLNTALRKRNYGQVPSPWADSNLSAQSAILRGDPPFAKWLAAKAGRQLPGTNYQAEQQRLRQQEANERMKAETERLRERNAATRARNQHQQIHGSRDRFTGAWR